MADAAGGARALTALRGRSAFEQLRRAGVRRRSGALALTWAPAPTGVAVGFAIGRNVGGAVVRNRLRRRLRAILGDAARAGELVPGSYLISARPEARDLAFSELESMLRRLLAQLPASDG